MRKSIFFFAFLALGITSCTEQTNSIETTDSEEPIVQEEPQTKTITFPSLDGLEITANLYEIDSEAPVIVLCHQARFNKFEYEGIAQNLNELGFNCIAIDQRSGGPIANQVNQTHLDAIEQGKPTDFVDAKQDIEAAVNYAAKNYSGPVILWGSSYSSTLVLYVGNENEAVDAIISFSPGNYFIEELGDLKPIMNEQKKPYFITSSKREAPEVLEFFTGIERTENQIIFVPEGDGHHGSRALWEQQTGGEEYWEAIKAFLKDLK
jgi:dienelactone hydrolase